ncbi:RagB/SusD family nutrient uptake outer membrane protein [Flagellimonas marina]|uniref:RagB/SusD family nutrient uptake outer membrane protein n=1 Tax=Flagellimonas marina TaxID=1775168 RepID=A0ABV8PGD7_9FLAO
MENRVMNNCLFKKADRTKHFTVVLLWALLSPLLSCEDFVEVDPPVNQLSGEVVFSDPATVEATLIDIYTQLRDNVLTVGNSSGLGFLLGIYGDELIYYGNTASDLQQFHTNSLISTNGTVTSFWRGCYNLIYAANSIIEGLESTPISDMDRDRYLGEAHFLRAFIHFYLVNIFGDVPYVDSTDFLENREIARLEEAQVYEKIIGDLRLAKSLLPIEYAGAGRARPNKWVATAMLSRTYLYMGQWQQALEEATEVVAQGGYVMNADTGGVFLKSSAETLWQLDTGTEGLNTLDAQLYVLTSGPPPLVSLSDTLVNSFEAGDARFTDWVGLVTDGSDTWYFPFKYRANTLTSTTQECSIMVRLAEMHLIMAEAHTRLGNLEGARAQLDIIRERAALPSIGAVGEAELLDAIAHERRVELFTELGHRFLDLKRTGTANTELSGTKPNWGDTDLRWPIPESELVLNPNLKPKNDGY